MKFIVASDIHGRIDLVEDLARTAKTNNAELVFLLGDYSFGFKDPIQNKEDVKQIMSRLEGLEYYMLLGNCDDPENTIELGGHNLHKKTIRRQDVSFTGFGASNPTPFNTAWELSEEQIKQELKTIKPPETNKHVFLTHTPAYGTRCDLTSTAIHAGSKSLREWVSIEKPQAMISGHIHEAAGCEDELGPTKVYAAGRLDGGCLLVDSNTLKAEYKPR